jgi:Flp pilus assembly pilin Flp
METKRKGQGFVEYVLLMALIVMVVVGSFVSMGHTMKDSADHTSEVISNVMP